MDESLDAEYGTDLTINAIAPWVEHHIAGAKVLHIEDNTVWLEVWTFTASEGSGSGHTIRLNLT